MTRFWTEMVISPGVDDERVCLEMGKRLTTVEEMRRLESLLEREKLIGPYAQHCARYVLLFKELVRRAVVEVRFGLNK
jgi:hypothetical protein